jgi:hypothetical protein
MFERFSRAFPTHADCDDTTIMSFGLLKGSFDSVFVPRVDNQGRITPIRFAVDSNQFGSRIWNLFDTNCDFQA